ncbi:probable pectinesterase 55 [Lotus japonicus]|uniref:probable pectinesterase 55 n=1 Tax=Lotus japonicus TaxID=34305 RepID=UPI00258A3EED|nr:probable pectinesterase 55 [Lotus japonicus]
MQSRQILSIIFTLQFLAFDAYESMICGNPPKAITVNQSGKGDFRTIQNAIDFVPAGNSQWIHIKISSGVYREQIEIPMNKSCIYLEGGGSGSTSIEWSTHEGATFYSNANNTVAKGITFKNILNRPVILEEEKNKITQAVAARVHADKCAFFNCAFLGVQDTLYDEYGRHYYHNCYIQGGVDFIFGNGQSIFEASTIFFSMGKFGPKMDGVITAHERDSPNDPSGFVFKNCIINGTGGKAELGRAMAAYSRVIIANSFLTNVVRPGGWSSRKYAGHE